MSVVVPVLNEGESILSLVDEIDRALSGQVPFEIIFVDDGSTDDTPARLEEARERYPSLRAGRHLRRAGQSAGINTGVMMARAPLIVTLDGDGQNDPTDIPKLLDVYHREAGQAPLLVAGHRTKRQDSWVKRVSSRIANTVRAKLLKDSTPDTGCGLKVFSRQAFLDMPRFDHMHRFLPALMVRQGGRVISVPVNHRPRERGASKYGTLDRLLVGIVDLAGVMWLLRRARMATVDRE